MIQIHWKKIGLSVLFLLVLLILPVISGLIFLWSANKISAIPFLVLIAFLPLIGLTILTTHLFSGWMGIKRRTLFVVCFSLGYLAFIFGAVYFLFFRPVPNQHPVFEIREDTQYWTLRDGLRIGYTVFPAVGIAHEAPIIYLHGGPGAVPHGEEFGDNFSFLKQFTADGFDVYLYDQIGCGRSDLLPQISGYSIQRNLDDLENIRQLIGVEKMILVGQSWGGSLAAGYLALYPQHVEKVVFTSPGEMWEDPMIRSDYRLTAGKDIDLDLPPRFLAAIQLLSINPQAAQNLVSQEEANQILEDVGSQILAQSFCKADQDLVPQYSPEKRFGFNFYANQITRKNPGGAVNPEPMLSSVEVPALILKGSCDFIPSEATQKYQQVLPNAEMAVLEGAGHLLWGSQPQQTVEMIRKFLLSE